MYELTRLLEDATRHVPKEYFQLPVVGSENTIYRERVYCYELYHRIRCLWPDDTSSSLCGEVDKSGHPLIRGNNLDNTKPDFLVHVPGQMDKNELVMEVKPINVKRGGFKKDLQSLTAYRRLANYGRAILLVYGGTEIDIIRLKKRMNALADKDGRQSIDLSVIELWHHLKAGEAAASVEW